MTDFHPPCESVNVTLPLCECVNICAWNSGSILEQTTVNSTGIQMTQVSLVPDLGQLQFQCSHYAVVASLDKQDSFCDSYYRSRAAAVSIAMENPYIIAIAEL